MSSLCSVMHILQHRHQSKSRMGTSNSTAEIQIAGNKTMEYANLNYQGTEYPETDVAGMGYLHLDYFTTDATTLEFFLITKVVLMKMVNQHQMKLPMTLLL